MYRNFKSQLGYENGENKIDSYGVDHSNFSLRDEVSYQMARTNRENELIKNHPEFGMDDRILLRDDKLTEKEKWLVNHLIGEFSSNDRLHKHIDFLLKK